MLDYSKYQSFIDNLLKDSPEFMLLKKDNEDYLIFDRFVSSLSDKAMPWLVKVYLEQQYDILKNDKFTFSIRRKYPDLSLRCVNSNGNLFFNKDGLCGILMELHAINQLQYDENSATFNLI